MGVVLLYVVVSVVSDRLNSRLSLSMASPLVLYVCTSLSMYSVLVMTMFVCPGRSFAILC